MSRQIGWLAAGLLAWPAQAEDAPPPPDPEFLEFLGATADTDERFMEFLESPAADRELRRAGDKRRVAKDGKDES